MEPSLQLSYNMMVSMLIVLENSVYTIINKVEGRREYENVEQIVQEAESIGNRILKGLEWPLVASFLSEKQCDSIIRPLLKSGLRANGVQWRINRDILYTSPSLLGLGFPNLYTSMAIQKDIYLINNGCKSHLSGQLTLSSLSLMVIC